MVIDKMIAAALQALPGPDELAIAKEKLSDKEMRLSIMQLASLAGAQMGVSSPELNAAIQDAAKEIKELTDRIHTLNAMPANSSGRIKVNRYQYRCEEKKVVIKSKVKASVNGAWPRLMETESGVVVLFSAPNQGTVVHVGENVQQTIGNFSECWSMNTFRNFNGSVTLGED